MTKGTVKAKKSGATPKKAAQPTLILNLPFLLPIILFPPLAAALVQSVCANISIPLEIGSAQPVL